MAGKMCEKSDLFLHRSVGEATDESGKGYEMALIEPSGTPIVKSRQTGKRFVLPWSDIIDIALAAGIDKEGMPDLPVPVDPAEKPETVESGNGG